MKALIGFKAFYFFGSVSVRFRCICEMALKDSDMDSENLSSLIRLSVSDGQKTDSSKVVSVIDI